MANKKINTHARDFKKAEKPDHKASINASLSTYEKWIVEYRERNPNLLGLCKSASEEMKQAFPELSIVKGHVYVPGWGKRGHVWLEAPGGVTVDPTAAQYETTAITYEPWQPGDEVRVGKCMECGDEIWVAVDDLEEAGHQRSFCDTTCESAFVASLM